MHWNMNALFVFRLISVICVFDLDFWKTPFMSNNTIVSWRIKQRHWNIQTAFHCGGCKFIFSETTLLIGVHLFLLVVTKLQKKPAECSTGFQQLKPNRKIMKIKNPTFAECGVQGLQFSLKSLIKISYHEQSWNPIWIPIPSTVLLFAE